MSTKLIIFVRAPRVGEVKTRLASKLSREGACAAYRQLVQALLRNLRKVAHVELCYTPADAEGEIRPWLQPGWTCTPQVDGDLGVRMLHASAGGPTLIIGSDCPYVTAKDIREAEDALLSHDVVIGPATDGGYWLIGTRQPQPALFADIAWSSESVLAETLSRARANGLKVHLLRLLTDVDTAEDWEAFQSTATTR